ncbi:hypothetical protein NLI96_g6440 [Meripilus lineatus]|uniref:Uncharacterized protein n=1 Tax=Meripilus lineatus TaxID=2056292 RepID=A0AAD5V0V9_9APHY|nr:hypothetical protein NLI96_g6440 [Physisporinus lineatus]
MATVKERRRFNPSCDATSPRRHSLFRVCDPYHNDLTLTGTHRSRTGSAILAVQIFAIISSEIGTVSIQLEYLHTESDLKVSVTVIFLNRFMLNLRGLGPINSSMATITGHFESGRALSSVRFAPGVVGNLGASLGTVVGVELDPEGSDIESVPTGSEADATHLPNAQEDIETGHFELMSPNQVLGQSMDVGGSHL